MPSRAQATRRPDARDPGRGRTRAQEGGAMRIGFDGGCLANRRGFGRFARRLLAALAETPSRHEFVVFVDRPSAEVVRVPERFETAVVGVREAPSRAASAAGSRSLGDLWAMGRAVARA